MTMPAHACPVRFVPGRREAEPVGPYEDWGRLVHRLKANGLVIRPWVDPVSHERLFASRHPGKDRVEAIYRVKEG